MPATGDDDRGSLEDKFREGVRIRRKEINGDSSLQRGLAQALQYKYPDARGNRAARQRGDETWVLPLKQTEGWPAICQERLSGARLMQLVEVAQQLMSLDVQSCDRDDPRAVRLKSARNLLLEVSQFIGDLDADLKSDQHLITFAQAACGVANADAVIAGQLPRQDLQDSKEWQA